MVFVRRRRLVAIHAELDSDSAPFFPVPPRRIIEGGRRDLAQVLMEHYRFWYHDQMDVTSQVRAYL